MGAVDFLLRDRFAEFQRLARSKGTIPPEGTVTVGASQPTSQHVRSGLLSSQAPGEKAAAKDSFMREFFDFVKAIQEELRLGQEDVKQMDLVLQEALQATTRQGQQAASERLEELTQVITRRVTEVKMALDIVKRSSDGETTTVLPPPRTPSEQKIRGNLKQALAKKHQELLLNFQRAQLDFKKMLQSQQIGEMRILCPEASDEEVIGMIQDGETASKLMVKKMAGAHAVVLEEVQRIFDKHQDILRLEQSVADLAQMFQEVAILVDAQGELLDQIEVHVHTANEYTGKAVKELHIAKKTQQNTRKWWCCLAIFLLIVVICILFPILIKRN